MLKRRNFPYVLYPVEPSLSVDQLNQKLVSTGILLYENGHHQLLYLGHGGFAISSQKYNSVIFAVDFGNLKQG